MTATKPRRTRLSDLQRHLHRSCLDLARLVRHDSPEHALVMQQAASARFYFAQLRSLGE